MPSARGAKIAALEINKPLFEAIDALSLKAVEKALDQGADPTALYKGRPVIYHAAEHDYDKMITKLVKGGANVDAMTTWGRTVLHFAAEKNKLETAACVLGLGANPNALDETGRTALQLAAEAGATEMISLLASKGADMNASDESGRTALHSVATREGGLGIATLLIKMGAAVDPVDMNSSTPLLDACGHGELEMVKLLVENGANLQIVDSNGRSALHHAATDSSSAGPAKAAYLIEKGIPVDVRDQDQRTPLHHAAMTANINVARILIEKRANPKAVDKDEITVLRQLILSDGYGQLSDVYAMAQLICSHGAKLAPPPPAAKKSNFEPWQLGMRACVRHWQAQHEEGTPFTHVEIEVVQRGEAAVKNYLEDLKRARMDQLRYRRKICIVGPSEWGKTSLVKSLTTEKPSLLHIDDRTIGIDLFSYAFDKVLEQRMEIEHHEVTFWDFAGQDVYQVAHALFFSPRTLYLVCVNLEAYATALEAAEGFSLSQAEASMNRFVSLNVLRWIRLIFTRQPDAQFVFVGTKVDQLKDAAIADTIRRDLQARLFTWKRDLMVEIDEAYQQPSSSESAASLPMSLLHKSGSRRAARRAELTAKLDAIVNSDWITVSSINHKTVTSARESIKAVVLKSDRSYLMPPTYTLVLEAIEKRRQEAAHFPDVRDRIEHTIVPFSALYSWLAREIEHLEADAFVSILQMLHDVGDILWYEHVASSFKNIIILDPTLVIDYVREVVNHKLSDAETLAEDGRLAHAVLRTIPFWKESDEELTHAFKLLLQQFQLAHPADSKTMDWDSDLIVPAYWKVRRSDSDASAHLAPQTDSTTKSFVWEYAIAAELSETVFDHFAVHSYSPLFARSVWRNCIESSVEKEFVSRIELLQNNAVRDVIRMELTAVDEDVGWQCMRFFIMAMEEVLEDYPGLIVSRYIVDGYSDRGEKIRHRVADAVSALQDTIAMGRSVEALRVLMPWIPPDMSWFVEKAWRVPGKLHEIQLRSNVKHVVNKVEVLKKLVVASDSRRKLPALWTTEYIHGGKDVELRMFSDLSGECFHDRIKIELSPEFLSVYSNTFLQAGIAIYSNIGADAISVSILKKAIELVLSDASSRIEAATSVHCVIDNIDEQTLQSLPTASNALRVSPRTAVSMLGDLLKCHDTAFDELQIGDIAKLECAVTSDGRFVWASRQEIMALGEELTPCDPRDLHKDDAVDEVPNAEEVDTAEDPSLEQVDQVSESTCKHVKLRLTLVGTKQLPAWDWRRVYCKWELVHAKLASVVASGSTSQHADDTSEPSWRAVGFTITSGIESIEFLRECQLQVKLKRPSRWLGVVKLVSEGSLAMSDAIESFGCVTVDITLANGSSRKHTLVCELDASSF